MDNKIKIEDSHYQYLRIQKGNLANITDRHMWDIAYNTSINNAFNRVVPLLPDKCNAMLDIGSGLGGINILFSRYYNNEATVCLLDGENDKPEVVQHNIPFNNMVVARDFMAKNGVKKFRYLTPDKLQPSKFDLITSFASWCFHYPPEVYLDFVLKCCHKDTILLLQVRKEQPTYFESLDKHFLAFYRTEGKKFYRMAYRCKK